MLRLCICIFKCLNIFLILYKLGLCEINHTYFFHIICYICADSVIQDKKRREDERVEEIPDKEGSVKKQVNDEYVVFWEQF